MKLRKVLAALSAAVLLAGAVIPASAAPRRGQGARGVGVQAAAQVLGQDPQEVLDQAAATQQCLGMMMESLGKLDEFHQEVLRLKGERLQDRVDSGVITQEQADQILEDTAARQAACDGTGQGQGNGVCDGTGQGFGNGNGQGQGLGQGNGVCDGTGQGRGNGQGGGMGRGRWR